MPEAVVLATFAAKLAGVTALVAEVPVITSALVAS